MVKLTVSCNTCNGSGYLPAEGITAAPDTDDYNKQMREVRRHFPRLCDKCGGSGRMPAPPVPSGG